MMKRTLVLWCVVCLLVGCKEVVHFEVDERSRALVLNSVMTPDSDSIRIELTQTSAADDSSGWRTFPAAEVLLFEDGSLLGNAGWNERGYFLYHGRVRPQHTYRITATVPQLGTVWGETTIPERLDNCELDFLYELGPKNSYRVDCRWQDTPGKRNFYWFGAKYSPYIRGQEPKQDTLNLKDVAFYETNSSLPDPFNRVFEDESKPQYEYYIRVEDSGLDGQALSLSYQFFYTDAQKIKVYMLNADRNYDAYVKSIIENYENSVSIDGFPLIHHPAYVHTNVHGGVGLVASYISVDKTLNFPNE